MRLEDPQDNSIDNDAGGMRSKSFLSRMGAIGTGVILTGFLMMTVSRAAFVASTDNTGNTASTGQLSLDDNDTGLAMFDSLVDAAPGDVDQSCITVTYTGSFDPGLVKMYTAGITGDIENHLDLVIEASPATLAPSFDDCTTFVPDLINGPVYTGTVGDFDANRTDYATGVDTGWDPTTTGETKTFRITVTVGNAADGANRSGTFGFVWETQ